MRRGHSGTWFLLSVDLLREEPDNRRAIACIKPGAEAGCESSAAVGFETARLSACGVLRAVAVADDKSGLGGVGG